MKSYLQDSDSYAKDLTAAAELEDWNLYRDIQAQLAAETTAAMLTQVAQVERGKRDAIAAVPGLKEFHGSPEYERILAENETLGEAVLIAEANSSLQHKLPSLYKIVLNLYRADQTTQRQTATQTAPHQPVHSATYDGPDERLASSESRRKVITELEAAGLADDPELFGRT